MKIVFSQGLTASERVLNSMNYAFPDGRLGENTVSLKKIGRDLQLIVAGNEIDLAERMD